MSKVVISPFKKFPGSVTLYDPLTLPQVELIEAAFVTPEADENGKIWLTILDKPKLPAVLACVETWNIENLPSPPLTIDNFYMSPRRATSNLITWLFDEIRMIYLGELEIPNE